MRNIWRRSKERFTRCSTSLLDAINSVIVFVHLSDTDDREILNSILIFRNIMYNTKVVTPSYAGNS